MKISVSLICLFFGFSAIASEEVYFVDYQVPHACENVNMSLAVDILEGDCQALGLSLTSHRIGSCEPNGNDGGSTDYFAVTVIGDCE